MHATLILICVMAWDEPAARRDTAPPRPAVSDVRREIRVRLPVLREGEPAGQDRGGLEGRRESSRPQSEELRAGVHGLGGQVPTNDGRRGRSDLDLLHTFGTRDCEEAERRLLRDHLHRAKARTRPGNRRGITRITSRQRLAFPTLSSPAARTTRSADRPAIGWLATCCTRPRVYGQRDKGPTSGSSEVSICTRTSTGRTGRNGGPDRPGSPGVRGRDAVRAGCQE